MPASDKHSEDRSRRRLVWAVAAALLLVLLPLGGGASAATSSGANGDIAFVRGGDLYLVSTGTVLVSGAIDPSWSPDGKKLAFSLGGAIETCALIGTTCAPAALATPASGTEPVWSADGTKIAFVNSGNIHTVTSTGAGDTTIVTGTDPSWSPDGTKIAYTSGGSVFTCTVSSCSGTQLVSAGSQPAWSPDSATIAYQAVSGGHSQIFVIPAGGGTATQVTGASPSSFATDEETAPNWSPDSGSIVYADSVHGIQDVTQGGGGVWGTPTTRDSNTADATPDWQTIAPLAVAPPSISGGFAPQTGQQLSTTNGTWSGASSGGYSYVWQRCDSSGNNCSAIGGATASTYAVVSADLGNTLRTVVTASNIAGSTASSASAATGVVTLAGSVNPPVNTVAPVITLPTGETVPELGDILFASAGTWTGSFPMTFAYSWAKCPAADPLNGPCTAIPGATLSFFTVPAALYGYRIRVRVTASNSAAVVPQTSAATEVVSATAPSLSVTPAIQGQNVVDQTLSVGTGTWFGSTPLTFTYQWKRCNPVGDLASCVPIALATKSTYVPTTADIGFSLRVYITATNPAGASTGFTNHTYPVVDKQHFKPLPVSPPAIAGTLQIGRQLTADAGSFDGDTPITTKLQWQRCDATGAACRAIAKATKVVYFPTVNDLGSTLRFVVTAKNAYGTTVADSEVTEPVLGVPPHRRGRRIVGTNGPDYLTGGGYDDVILGEGGNDAIFGGAGDDRLYGGPGNDVITGGAGADRIYGGPGSDTIYANDGERDFIDCGAGRDRAVVDSVDVVKNCEVVTVVGSSSTGTAPSPGTGSPGSP